MTLAIIAMCGVLVSRSHRRVMQRTAFVAAAAAASRIVLVALPTMQGKSNDEREIMLALGWSAQIIWTAEAALTTLLLVWIIRRNVGSLLLSEVALTLLGIFAGWMSAFTLGRAIGLPISQSPKATASAQRGGECKRGSTRTKFGKRLRPQARGGAKS
jgi:hypothetical protein